MTPDAKTLLAAVAALLDRELAPALKAQAPGLAYRARIAAHLAGSVARGLAAGDLDAGWRALNPDAADGLSAARQLAADLRADALDAAALARAQAVIHARLVAELHINAPQFDLRPDPERPHEP